MLLYITNHGSVLVYGATCASLVCNGSQKGHFVKILLIIIINVIWKVINTKSASYQLHGNMTTFKKKKRLNLFFYSSSLT